MTSGGPLSLPAFRRFWLASSVSAFGSYVTVVAIQVLVVVTLHGSAAQVGLVSGARWLPYLLFGLVAGVLIDRYRRRPVLVVSDVARGVLLAAIPVLSWTDVLTVPVLMAVMVMFGTLSLANDAASQSFVPRVVTPDLTTAANARLDQSDALAQTSGPVAGGALVAALSAPAAVLVDAASYLASGLTIASISVREPDPAPVTERHFGRELSAGLRWVYRHRTLAPLAVWTHGWFLFASLFGTVLAPFVLRTVGLNALGLGVVLTAAGIGALLGSSVAGRLGRRFGTGRVVVACWALNTIAYAVVAVAPGRSVGGVVLGIGEFLLGLSMGAENANSLGYRQAITPDELQGRTNTTIRSVNRAVVVIGAPLGGLLADSIGYREAIWVAAVGMLAVTVALACSPFRAVTAGSGQQPENAIHPSVPR